MKGIEISNPQRVIYPQENITKLDVIKYYEAVSKLMLPYVSNRLLSVIRCHSDILGGTFFKKHPNMNSGHIKIFNKNGEEFFYITSAEGLILEAQNGTVEFHMGGSSITGINNPNYMVFDLDPDENLNIDTLRQGVIYLKKLLDELNLKSFLKTSGGKGYHIVIPFKASTSWQIFNDTAKQIAIILEAKHPKLYTTNIRKNNRKGKIFIDYLRNDKGSTCVAPYSLRARPHAPVSMPILWNELTKIKPDQITLPHALKKIKNKNPWQDFWKTTEIIK